MTVNHSTSRARRARLTDGTPIVLWTEHDPTTITILVADEDNEHLAHVQARRHGLRGAAELTIRTEPFMRRHGVDEAALPIVMAWAQRHGVPFLVGSLPTSEPGAPRPFPLERGFPVAVRSWNGTARFALQVPAPAGDHEALDDLLVTAA